MKATKWLGLFNTISAYLLPPTAAVVQNNLQSIRPGLLTPRLGLAARLGAQSGNAVLAMYRKTRSKLPDQLITYTFVKSVTSSDATFIYEYYYAIQRTAQNPISLTYTTTTVYRDEGKELQGFITAGEPVVITSDTTGLAIGDKVRGGGVPEDAVIQAIDLNKSFTLSIAATLSTVVSTTQTLQIFPGSVSVPSFAEDRFGKLYTFFGNGIKPQMLRTAQNFTVDVGIESPTALANVTITKNSMSVERVDVFGGSGGFSEPPQITFVGTSVVSATAVAILDNGAISAVEVTSGGSGYTSAPLVEVDDKRRGSGFLGTGVLSLDPDFYGFPFTTPTTFVYSSTLLSGHSFASSLTAGGLPVVTQVGPQQQGTATLGSNVITFAGFSYPQTVVTPNVNRIVAGMSVSGTGIPAGTRVRKVKTNAGGGSPRIVIDSVATATGLVNLTFVNLVTLAYDSANQVYIGKFPLLDLNYRIAGTGSNAAASAENTGISAVASITFTEIRTNYRLDLTPIPVVSGSLNNGLYTPVTYFNATNRGYFGLVASQSTLRWGNHTRENTNTDAFSLFRTGPAWNGIYRNYWFPNYQYVTVWQHTGTKSSLGKAQWLQQEYAVKKISATKAYIDIPLFPEQISEGVPSPLSTNFVSPVVRVFLAYAPAGYAPAGWDRSSIDPFNSTQYRNAPAYQRNGANGWLGTASGQLYRPVVDFWKSSGNNYGWDTTNLQSSFTVEATNRGSGINQNATFLLRFASACASHELGTAERNARILEQTIPRAANSNVGIVEGGWGAHAFDIKFTADSLEAAASSSTSLPGAILDTAIVIQGNGYPGTNQTSVVTLNQYTTAFVLSNTPINISNNVASSDYSADAPTDRIASVTVNTGGANYAGQPTFVLDTLDGSGYGVELSAVIADGEITTVNVIDRGHGFKFPATVSTLTAKPNLTAVMRPTFKGVYSCAYRYADWTDTVIGTCYACTVTGGSNQSAIQLDDAGAELVKTGYILDGDLYRFQTKVTSLVGSVAGTSRGTTNRPSNSTLSFTATLTSGAASFWAVPTTGILVGMGVANTTLIPAGTTIATYANGTGATFNVTILSGGVLSIAVAFGGTGYTNTAPLIITTTGTPTTNASFAAIVTNGAITGVNTSTGGSGYTNATVAVSAYLVMSNPALANASGTIVVNRIQPVVSQAGTLTSNSDNVLVSSSIGLQIGQHVRGTGIPDDTYILAIPTVNQNITLSNLATAGGTNTLLFGWRTLIRDMSLPIAYSNFSPIQTVSAGPTVADLPTGRLNWAWNANIHTPERVQIVETWRTNGDQSLVFYRTEVWAQATPASSITPVVNILASEGVTAGQAALLPRNALRGFAAGTNDFDELSDEGLFSFTRNFYAALPVVLPNGGLNAYRFDQPRTDMRVCAAYNDRLWYAVSTSGLDVNTIFFSEYDEFESCPETNALTIQQNQKLTDSLTALMPYGSVLLAGQENHIYQVTYSTDPAIDASIALLVNRGVYNQRCWDIYDDEIYCLDRRGMYTMTAGGQVTSISDAVQSYWIDKEIEASRTEAFFVKIDSRAAVVRAFVVINDSNAPGPNLVLCYSINTKTWWTETYPNSLTSSSSYRPESTLIHDDVYSAIDGTIYALDGKSDSGFRSITSVLLTSGGSGYLSPPRVTATLGQGSGARFQALIKNGVVTDILIVERGTDYGTVVDNLSSNATFTGSGVNFTCEVGHLLAPANVNNVQIQLYTDSTYRVASGSPINATVSTVLDSPTATRRPFVATSTSSSATITVVNPTALRVNQYVDTYGLVSPDPRITAIAGNSITLSAAMPATAFSGLTLGAYAPRSFTLPAVLSGFPATGFATILSIAAINAGNTAPVISQTFDNVVALTIEPPLDSEGTTAVANAYCQNPPAEYILIGDWAFTATSALTPTYGTALITFALPHPFARGQQLPIEFTDNNYSIVNSPTHNPNDQNQEAGTSDNWYVTATTRNTITVLVQKNGSVTLGKAQCTAQGLPNQLFTVGLQYKTGAMELVSDDNTPKGGSNFVDRSVTVLYQPTSEPRSLILREYYNNSNTPKVNLMARNRGTGFIHELNGAQTVLDMASTRSPLGVATGVAKAIFGSRTAGDMSGADTHIAVELIVPSELKTEVDATAISPTLYGLTVNGIVEQ